MGLLLNTSMLEPIENYSELRREKALFKPLTKEVSKS